MCKKSDEGTLRELLDSIKYAIESKNGKYSMNTYLDIVEKFTDKLILQTENEDKLQYIGGECAVSPDVDQNSFCFMLKLYFSDAKGERILKEANRNIAMKSFTSETIEEIGKGKKFEICRPDNVR